ncbi:MAG: BPSS1780 family membrane protein [Burkholderiales bacterium]|jgi:uncharacterized membrane protein|nr:hypothetical protein [Betaproteobacteria bacterium]
MRVVDVSAASSAAWISEAFTMFWARPLAWISLTSAWLLVSLLITLIPLVGPPLMAMTQPAFFAGFVLACRDQALGLPTSTAHLFAGFRLSGRSLIQVGSVSLLAELAVMMTLGAFGFFDALKAIDRNNPSVEAIAAAFSPLGWQWFAAAAAVFVIKGVLWFTAALIAHQPMPASHAIRWSFFALIGNFVPLAMFGILMLGLLFLALIPWGLGLLIFVPLYAITHYTSFKGVFRADAE